MLAGSIVSTGPRRPGSNCVRFCPVGVATTERKGSVSVSTDHPSILEALNATPARTGGMCKLGRALEDIPNDTPGRDDLLAAVDDPTGYAAQPLSLVFSRLGIQVGPAVIRDHRASRCVCFR